MQWDEDHARARGLATESRNLLANAGLQPPEAAEIASWLASH